MSLLEWVAALFLVCGGFFVLVGGVGMLRMPDLYTRMHAASVTETMGTLLIMTGLILIAGWTLASVKLFAILLFLLFTGPVASYAVANTALIAGIKPQLAEDGPQIGGPEVPRP